MLKTSVSSHNEWDPLEEIIVGRAENAQFPEIDRSLFAVEFMDYYDDPAQIPIGAFPAQVIDETAEDLEILCQTLSQLGVAVQRPAVVDHSRHFATPYWDSAGIYNYCPRDLILVVGDLIIETPAALRSRYFEVFSYRSILQGYFLHGARWVSAPKPLLLDDSFIPRGRPEERLADIEPIFDAANILRLGRDLLFLVSSSGNRLGIKWLQSLLGDKYRVWGCENLYAATHIDSTLSLLRPGLVLLNPARVTESTVPEPLRRWDKIWCPEMVDTGYIGAQPYSSVWVGMNLLMINPNLAIVEKSQRPLIEVLTQHGIEVVPLPLRHSRTLGGGFHCVTLDVRRNGVLEDYAT